MNDLTPLTLEPVVIPKTWGGRRLEAFGKFLPGKGGYGESWEVADLPPGAVTGPESSRSPVSVGVHAGMTLRSLIETHGADLLGSADPTPGGDFPLLVKLLDAREPLSIQVHPTEEYVASHPSCWLKTESWYIVEAEPDAVIYKGLRSGVSVDDVREAAGSAGMVALVNEVPAVVGAFHHLPAGTIHALGAGVLVAEVQTPSDTTFRMYDWTEEYDRETRTLHIVEATETLDPNPGAGVVAEPMSFDGVRSLVDTEHYWLREHSSSGGPIQIEPGRELRILMVVRGTAVVSAPGAARLDLGAGATVVVPAAIAGAIEVEIVGGATVLEVGLV